MRIEIAGAGANARHRHPLGEMDLVRQPALAVAADAVRIGMRCIPARAIQVKRAETTVTLSVEEVFALFHDVTAALALDAAAVQARLEAVRQARAEAGTAAPRRRT